MRPAAQFEYPFEVRILRFRNRPGTEDAYNLADDLLHAGRTIEALDILREGLHQTPADVRLLMLQGQVRLREGELLSAQDAFLRASRVAPSSPQPLRWLGDVLLKRGDPARAARVLGKAIELDPSDPALVQMRERAERLSRLAAEPAPELPPLQEDSITVQRPLIASGIAENLRSSSADEGRQTRVYGQEKPSSPPRTVRHVRREREPTARGAFSEGRRSDKKDGPSEEPLRTPKSEPPPRGLFGTVDVQQAGAPHGQDAHGEDDPASWSVSFVDEMPEPDEGAETTQVTPGSPVPPPPDVGGLAAVDPVPGPRPSEVDTDLVRGLGALPAAMADVTPRQVRKWGGRLKFWIGLMVLLPLLGAAGFFAWNRWRRVQEQQAAEQVQQARELAARGDARDLVQAVHLLRTSGQVDPSAPQRWNLLLFVLMQQGLESGELDERVMRQTVALAERAEPRSAYIRAARAVLEAWTGDSAKAVALLEKIGAYPGGADREILYVSGWLRLGEQNGRVPELLAEAAADGELLSAAVITYARELATRGEEARAQEMLATVRKRYPNHVRSYLWSVVLAPAVDSPGEILDTLRSLELIASKDLVLRALAESRLYKQLGEEQSAVEALDRAAAHIGTDGHLLARVAAQAMALGRLETAERLARRALEASPQSGFVRETVARVFVARSDGVGALSVLEPVDLSQSGRAQLTAEAALIVGTRSALEQAIEAIDAVQGDEPDLVLEALRLRLQAHLGLPTLDRAKQLAKAHPGRPEVLWALAASALAERQPRLVIEALEDLPADQSDGADAQSMIGDAHALLAEHEEAETAYRNALAVDGSHLKATRGLGRLLLHRGTYLEAEEFFRGVIENATVGKREASIGLIGLAEVHIRQGKLEEARQSLKALDVEAAGSEGSLLAWGRLHLTNGDFAKAIEILEPLARAPKASAELRTLYGDALYGADRVDTAAHQYEQALQVDESYPDALIGRARVHLRAERPDDAVRLLEQAEKALAERLRPPSLEAVRLTLLGQAHLFGSRPKRDEARDVLRAATSMDDPPDEAWFFLGEALSGSNAPAARRAYKKYLRLAPNGPYARRAERAM